MLLFQFKGLDYVKFCNCISSGLLLLLPIFRWTHIVTDRVRVIYNSIHTEVIILFVATLEGVIKKFFLLPQPVRLNDTSVSACFLEELHLMPSDRLQPIEQLELIRPRVS